MFDMVGSIGADVIITDPTAPSYVQRGWDESRLLRSVSVPSERSMIPLVMTTLGKLGPSAETYLKSLADVSCSSGCVDRGVWLRIAKQYLSCASVRGHGVVFRHYYKTIAKCAGKGYRHGAVVTFE